MSKISIIPAFGVAVGASLALSVGAQAATISLTPDADTYIQFGTNQDDNSGAATDLYIRELSTDTDRTRDYIGYVRFNLATLNIGTINSATLTLSQVASGNAGERNDTIVPGRFTLYGLNNTAENTAQDWGELSLTYNNAGTDRDLQNLTSFEGLESVSGSNPDAVISVTGQGLVDFLQSRVDDAGTSSGLATVLADYPGPEPGNRAYQLGTKEFTADVSKIPTLTLDYTPVPEPASVALLGLGGLALLGRRRRRA